MKTTLLKLVFAVGALFALANCSKSDGNSSSAYGNCAAGQSYTQAGCISSQYCNGVTCMYNGQQLQIINQGYNNGYANGQVCTQVGLLPVGACSGLPQFTPQYPNYGFYQGNCYPVINQGYNNGGYNTGYNNNTQCNGSMNNGGWY